MSIKKLANELKNQKTPEKTVVEKVDSVSTSVLESPFFSSLREELKSKQIDNKVITYIDKDVTEVFALIKKKCKIPISTLLSHIAEEWIEKNKEEIKKLPTNKYL